MLFVACCLLFVVCWLWLSGVCCLLLFVVRCFVVRCMLLVVGCSLLVVVCWFVFGYLFRSLLLVRLLVACWLLLVVCGL